MSDVNRPLSPHLQVYRWGAHMLVSILHRATGTALAFGILLLIWWLAAVAQGPAAYEQFLTAAYHPIGRLVLFGFTWAVLQHMCSGLRHLYTDTGAGYELKANRLSAAMTLVLSTSLTLLVWIIGYGLI
ncbi:MAG: succinate dehydrogenase, cytochrome b556 subunit [Pseudomonadota bacterium]